MELVSLHTVILACIMGVVSYIIARWLKIPAILFYLLCGVIAGPLGVGIIDPKSLGTGLITLVEIAVAIILFEGGLSLSAHSFKSESFAIRRIIVVTIPLTGLGAMFLAHYILGTSWKISAFFGALIVVTGPTVIGSLLKSVYLKRRLEVILNWESIWGDVIGVLLSALALEFINLYTVESLRHAGAIFLYQILIGLLIGVASGFFLAKILLPFVIKLKDPVLPGLIVVMGALATFYGSNLAVESSGPLAVAVAGFSLSTLEGEALHEIRHFKEQLSSLFIGTLFVLLSAYINPMPLIDMWPNMLLVAFILGAVVRPAAVYLALFQTPVTMAERTFIGLIGPRGIIAVATASYASFILDNRQAEMDIILNLTFAIIFFSGTISTILCSPLAKLLNVRVPVSGSGILVVGINTFTSSLAKYLAKYVPVVFVDTNPQNCSTAREKGHQTVCADYLSSDLYQEAREEGFGRLLVATLNDALNEVVAHRASTDFEPNQVYRVFAGDSVNSIMMEPTLHVNIAFDDTFYLSEAVRKIDRGEAALAEMSAVALEKKNVIPLLKILNNNQGIEILKPHQSIKQDETVVCFVSK